MEAGAIGLLMLGTWRMILRALRQLKRKCEAFPGPTDVLVAFMALAVFMGWFPAQAGQPSSRGKVLHLDARGLDLLLQSDPNLLLIDVRTPDELTGPLGKIAQSRNVSMQELVKNPEQFPRDKTLVLICRSGHRSLKAADLLAEHGYVVYSVDEGMQAWRKLHLLAPPGAGGAPQQEHPTPTSDTGKLSPQENMDRHPSEKFFDSDMGC
jgi:rhodanese-related sulfurtransferase